MSTSISARQLTDVISVVCDAIHRLVVEDDLSGAVRRLEEAAGGLHAEITTRIVEGDGLTHILRAIKTLAHALEALASDNQVQAELQIRTAVDALSGAVHRLRSTYGDDASGPAGESIQMSVSEAMPVPSQEAIGETLRTLMTRTDPEAFVIFVDAQTGNFVQFIGSKGKPLVLELPFASLSGEVFARAKVYFQKEGIQSAGGEESFSIPIGSDVGLGTRLALGIFKEVFLSRPDFSLKIEEN